MRREGGRRTRGCEGSVKWSVHFPSLSLFHSDVAQKCYCGSANCRGYLGQSKQTGAFRVGGGRLPRDIGSPRESGGGGGGGGGWRRRHTARADNREDSMVRKCVPSLYA